MTLIEIAQQKRASAPDWKQSLAARIAAIAVYALIILSACAAQGTSRATVGAAHAAHETMAAVRQTT